MLILTRFIYTDAGISRPGSIAASNGRYRMAGLMHCYTVVVFSISMDDSYKIIRSNELLGLKESKKIYLLFVEAYGGIIFISKSPIFTLRSYNAEAKRIGKTA